MQSSHYCTSLPALLPSTIRVSGSSYCLPSLMNVIPEYSNFSVCFSVATFTCNPECGSSQFFNASASSSSWSIKLPNSFPLPFLKLSSGWNQSLSSTFSLSATLPLPLPDKLYSLPAFASTLVEITVTIDMLFSRLETETQARRKREQHWRKEVYSCGKFFFAVTRIRLIWLDIFLTLVNREEKSHADWTNWHI